MKHALTQPSRRGREPATPFSPLESGEFASSAYWTAWCAKHRSASFLEQLRIARTHAHRRFLEEAQRLIAVEVARHGLSTKRCAYAGCLETALREMDVCAGHSLAGGAKMNFWESLERSTAGNSFRITPEIMAELTRFV